MTSIEKILDNEKLKNLSEKITELGENLGIFLNEFTYEKLDELDITELAALQNKMKQDLESVKLIESTLGRYHDIIRKTKLPDLMSENGINGISVAGVGRVSLIDDMYASIRTSNQASAFEWLSDHGHKALIKETVHPSSLKALMKSKLKGGEEIPEELFSVTPYTYSKITAEKKSI